MHLQIHLQVHLQVHPPNTSKNKSKNKPKATSESKSKPEPEPEPEFDCEKISLSDIIVMINKIDINNLNNIDKKTLPEVYKYVEEDLKPLLNIKLLNYETYKIDMDKFTKNYRKISIYIHPNKTIDNTETIKCIYTNISKIYNVIRSYQYIDINFNNYKDFINTFLEKFKSLKKT